MSDDDRVERWKSVALALRAELAAANARLQQTESEWRELAAEREAANARCAELEADLSDMAKAAGEINDLAAEANKDWSDQLERADALQATLDRVTALADRWEARADDMHEDARQILLNHARHIRDLTGPDIPPPEQHTCDDYCQTCREPGEA